MKQIIQKLLVLITALLLAVSTYAYDFEVDEIFYNVTSATELTCSITESDNKYEGDVIIPSHVNFMGKTFTVSSIEYRCFLMCEDLTSIILPETIVSIGELCFMGCTNLKEINIPESVISLGSQCFYGCINLTSIKLPTSDCSLGSFCFEKCEKLQTVNLPTDLKVIPYSCFEGCYSLESIDIPNTVEEIQDKGFFYCTNLKILTSPKNCVIGPNAFCGCTSLSEVTIDGNIDYGAFEDCNKDINFTFELNVNEIILSRLYETKESYVGYTNYKVTYTDFTFENSFKSLKIKDGDTPINIKCFYDDDDSFHGGNIYNYETVCKWGENVKDLYLGRDLVYATKLPEEAPKLNMPNLINLTIGYNIEDVTKSLDFGESLTHLKSLSVIPPIIPSNFTEFQYLFMEVEVPEESLDLYKNDPIWGNFSNLRASGVDNIEAEASSKFVTGWYDLNGRAVSEDYKGLVIVRFSDGSCKKMLNR